MFRRLEREFLEKMSENQLKGILMDYQIEFDDNLTKEELINLIDSKIKKKEFEQRTKGLFSIKKNDM